MSPSDYQEYDLNYPHLSSLAFMLSWGNQWRSSCMLCPWLQGWRAARRRRKQSSETSKSKSSCLSRSALLLTLGGVLSKCLDSLHYDKHCFFLTVICILFVSIKKQREDACLLFPSLCTHHLAALRSGSVTVIGDWNSEHLVLFPHSTIIKWLVYFCQRHQLV